MFDNLRDFSDDPLYEGEQEALYKEPELASEPSVAAVKRRRKKKGKFLGMTAQQRLLVSVMFMFAVCLIGTLAMFVMGKMSLF
ncbi:MAG TPA: hypothetical protein VK851_01715 [Anaerolineales bacterium]|nr:hypothetical protein [Anaerolineales bacterium]